MRPLALTLSVALLACPGRDPGASSATTSSTSTSGSTGTASTTTTSSSSTTGPTTTGSPTASSPSTTTTSTTGDSGNFAAMPDLPPPVACDPWNDTCPRGQKCKPYFAGDHWEGNCIDIDPDPAGTGEPCLGLEWSKTDECGEGDICWSFGDDLTEHTCVPLCTGAPDDAACADACSSCVRNLDLGVCPATCDPRAPNCPESTGCTIHVFEPHFFCWATGDRGPGESCTGSTACQEGLACVQSFLLPACSNDNCCAPVCDLALPDTCDAQVPGTVCAPWPDIYPDFNPACVPDGLGLCQKP